MTTPKVNASQLPRCPHQHAAGSYYDLLPWSECHRYPPDYATQMTNEWPMCEYDADRTCNYYEKLCRGEK